MTQKDKDLLIYGNYFEDENGKRLEPTLIRISKSEKTNETVYYLKSNIDCRVEKIKNVVHVTVDDIEYPLPSFSEADKEMVSDIIKEFNISKPEIRGTD